MRECLLLLRAAFLIFCLAIAIYLLILSMIQTGTVVYVEIRRNGKLAKKGYMTDRDIDRICKRLKHKCDTDVIEVNLKAEGDKIYEQKRDGRDKEELFR